MQPWLKDMSIQIEVPFDALHRPGVARALADLMTSLGGESYVEPPAASNWQPLPRYVRPIPRVKQGRPEADASGIPAVMTEADTGARTAQHTPQHTPRRPAPVTPIRGGAGRRRSRSRKSIPPEAMRALPPHERWSRYFAELPETSRRFLLLLEQRSRLTVDEAVAELGLQSPKAMGGLTGAMVRWAPQQGVHLPFEAREDEQGQRYWIWLGLPGEHAQN